MWIHTSNVQEKVLNTDTIDKDYGDYLKDYRGKILRGRKQKQNRNLQVLIHTEDLDQDPVI